MPHSFMMVYCVIAWRYHYLTGPLQKHWLKSFAVINNAMMNYLLHTSFGNAYIFKVNSRHGVAYNFDIYWHIVLLTKCVLMWNFQFLLVLCTQECCGLAHLITHIRIFMSSRVAHNKLSRLMEQKELIQDMASIFGTETGMNCRWYFN